jgi:hypothetical protein
MGVGCLRLVPSVWPPEKIPVTIRPDRLWGQPSLGYKGYRVSFSGVKPTGLGVDHTPPFSAKVKEKVQLHFYFRRGLPVADHEKTTAGEEV